MQVFGCCSNKPFRFSYGHGFTADSGHLFATKLLDQYVRKLRKDCLSTVKFVCNRKHRLWFAAHLCIVSHPPTNERNQCHRLALLAGRGCQRFAKRQRVRVAGIVTSQSTIDGVNLPRHEINRHVTLCPGLYKWPKSFPPNTGRFQSGLLTANVCIAQVDQASSG